jgi:methyltransferase (TIGR00027 family)
MNGVAKTSLLVAAMRAAETARSESAGRLFSDPHAERLAGSEGAMLLQRAIAESGDQPAIAIRTHYIDSKIMAALSQGIRQIVMLAAGMDSRAYRMPFPKGTKIFELDQPDVLQYKQEKLGQFEPNCERIALAVDLRQDWTQQLALAGLSSSKRTLWLVEGLLMYLEELQVTTLLERINTLAAPQDILLCDVLSRTLLDAPHMRNQLRFLESLGAPWKFGTNDPESWMKKFGWRAELSQPGDVAPARWPFPTAPLSVPNIPRGYYVEARKI